MTGDAGDRRSAEPGPGAPDGSPDEQASTPGDEPPEGPPPETPEGPPEPPPAPRPWDEIEVPELEEIRKRPAAAAPPKPPRPPRRRRRLPLLAGALVLAAIGFLVWYFLFRSDGEPSATGPRTTLSPAALDFGDQDVGR